MIKIRIAHTSDCKTVLNFMNELENSAFDLSSFQKLFNANLLNPDIIYLLALTNDLAVGFISCHIQGLLHHNARIAEIQEMFVNKNYRNKGVGVLMLKALKSKLTKRGVRQLEVVSNRKRSSAHRFYTSQKFDWTSKKFVLKF